MQDFDFIPRADMLFPKTGVVVNIDVDVCAYV